MPIFEVWHNINPSFRVTAYALGLFPRGFEHVADVEAENADDAYGKTQNISNAWVDRPYVKPYRSRLVGARSTSVGDVLVNTATDEHLAVDSVGFRAF